MMRKIFLFAFLVNVFSISGQNSNFLVELDSNISYNIISCRSDSMILDSATLLLENEKQSMYNLEQNKKYCDSTFVCWPKISFNQVADFYNPPEKFQVFDLSYRTESIHDSLCFGTMNLGFMGYWWTINDSILVLEPMDWKRVFVFYIFSEENKKYLISVPQPWFGISSFEKRRDDWHPPLIYPTTSR